MLFLGADTKEKNVSVSAAPLTLHIPWVSKTLNISNIKIRLQGPTFVIGVPNKMVTEGINTFIFHQKGELLMFFFKVYMLIYINLNKKRLAAQATPIRQSILTRSRCSRSHSWTYWQKCSWWEIKWKSTPTVCLNWSDWLCGCMCLSLIYSHYPIPPPSWRWSMLLHIHWNVDNRLWLDFWKTDKEEP